jgi:hypothetical protein
MGGRDFVLVCCSRIGTGKAYNWEWDQGDGV